MTDTPELVRAQAILAAGVDQVEHVDADNAARLGSGGALSIASTLHAMLSHGLSQYAAAFDLPYGGSTPGQPAQPTGGE